MPCTRREFMTTSAMVVGVCATARSGSGDSREPSNGNPGMSEELSACSEVCCEPLLFSRGHCSGYPYAVPEIDEPWTMPDACLHNPEIENKW